MNGFDRGAQLPFPELSFPLTVGGVLRAVAKRSILPSQSGNLIFCMECVRMNKDCFLLFVH